VTYTRTIILGVKAKLQNRSSPAVLLHAGLMMSSRIISAAGAEALRASITFGFMIFNPSQWRSFSLWSQNERGYGSRWPRDREVDPSQDTRLVARLTIGARGREFISSLAVHVRLRLRRSLNLATQRPKGRFADLAEYLPASSSLLAESRLAERLELYGLSACFWCADFR